MITSRIGSRECKSVWKRPHASSSSGALPGPTLPSIYKQVPPERKTAVSATLQNLCKGGGSVGLPRMAREWLFGTHGPNIALHFVRPRMGLKLP
jgi:hypothetical protein